MIDKPIIQTYINNFRRRLARFLKPGIGLTCFVHSAQAGGAILEFRISPGIQNDDIYRPPSPTIGKALSAIEQHGFAGNLDGFAFIGTNVVLERDTIILIKDESPSEWDDAAAEKDVRSILPSSPRANR